MSKNNNVTYWLSGFSAYSHVRICESKPVIHKPSSQKRNLGSLYIIDCFVSPNCIGVRCLHLSHEFCKSILLRLTFHHQQTRRNCVRIRKVKPDQHYLCLIET